MIDKYKKIVIKIGSSSIIDSKTKNIKSKWITDFCKDIAKIVIELLGTRSGTIIDEINLSPGSHSINFKQNS